MRKNENNRCGTCTFAVVVAIVSMSTVALSQNERVLHAFHLGDGAAPQGALIADSQQNLYGLTYAGGGGSCKYSNVFVGCGAVFELSRTPYGWTEQVLYAFQ